jgi:hypothetical protein
LSESCVIPDDIYFYIKNSSLKNIKGIEYKRGSKIYIYCPADHATGGPEALHQLGHHLRLLGYDANMHYFKMHRTDAIVHEDYVKYQVPIANVIENKPEHILILPEAALQPIFRRKFKLMQKAIWWLSVTNYYIFKQDYINSINRKLFLKIRNAFGFLPIPTFEKLKQENILNIAHSYYSLVHLQENGIEPVGQISDYMNDAFFELAEHEDKKEDIVIYNPRKNDEYLQEIISMTPDLKWMPLVNMSPQQVAGWMNRAKLYVDFGYHPGKERMPREACIMRCCLIIGKTGSAAYQQDMPIPEKYRFEKSADNIPGIIKQIKNCLTNYDEIINDFEPYRQTLYQEKEKFINDIKNVFIKV